MQVLSPKFERLFKAICVLFRGGGKFSSRGWQNHTFRQWPDTSPPVDPVPQVEFFNGTTCQNTEPPGKHRPKGAMWPSPVSGVLGVLGSMIADDDRRWFLRFKSCRPSNLALQGYSRMHPRSGQTPIPACIS